MFTDQKFALSANDDKRIQSTDSTEIYAYRTSKNPVCKKQVTDLVLMF